MNIASSDGKYRIADNKEELDLIMIHAFLSGSYWAKGITLDRVKSAVENSYCFGLFAGTKQIGFARVISDLTSLAYLLDVFVLEDFRSKGLGKMLINSVLTYSKFRNVKKWMLATSDAHNLYRKFDFKELKNPGKYMERTISSESYI